MLLQADLKYPAFSILDQAENPRIWLVYDFTEEIAALYLLDPKGMDIFWTWGEPGRVSFHLLRPSKTGPEFSLGLIEDEGGSGMLLETEPGAMSGVNFGLEEDLGGLMQVRDAKGQVLFGTPR